MDAKTNDSDSTSPRGWHSRGYLPHFDGGAVPQAVAFRLADSLPVQVIESWRWHLKTLPKSKAESELRRRIEEYLDAGHGECHLRISSIGAMVQSALHFYDRARYRLHAWVVMPNHVHVLFTPCAAFTLSGILHTWKSYSAKMANRILGRRGRFWQEDYFDRFVRNDEHFAAAKDYIENNPVKAGLCSESQEWPFSSASQEKAGETPALRSAGVPPA